MDQYAVAVVKGSVVVGHLPKKLSHIYSLFIRRGGVLTAMWWERDGTSYQMEVTAASALASAIADDGKTNDSGPEGSGRFPQQGVA